MVFWLMKNGEVKKVFEESRRFFLFVIYGLRL